LQRLSDDPALRQRMGQAGREKVVLHYDRKTNVTALAHLFVGVDPARIPVA
jgi:hypothetical protein